jgi:hypothetical protein
MLSIKLDINGILIDEVHCRRVHPIDVRVEDMRGDTLCDYEVFDRKGRLIGKIGMHKYGDGAEILGARALKLLRECKRTGVTGQFKTKGVSR